MFSLLVAFMHLWSVNEVVGVVISGQSANQSVSNLIWLPVCQSCQCQWVRNHPAPWRRLTLLTIAPLHCPPSNRIRLRWGNTKIYTRTYTCVFVCLCVLKCNTSLWLGRLHATLTSGIVCLRLTFLLNGTPYRLKLSRQNAIFSVGGFHTCGVNKWQ